MKLEEAKNFKLQYVINTETTTLQIHNMQDSDNEIAEKITRILNIYEKITNFEGKPSFKNWCNYYVVDKDKALLNADKNNKIIITDHKSKEDQITISTNT